MRRTTIISAAVSATAIGLLSSHLRAENYTWQQTAGGTYNWNTASNWSPAGVPSVAGDQANLSVGITGNQTINISSDVTISNLHIGSTANPVETNVGSTGGSLILNGDAEIVSGGVEGATNIISAPVVLLSDGDRDFTISETSTNSLVFAGTISVQGTEAGTDTLFNLVNDLPDHLSLTLNNLVLSETGSTGARTLLLKGGGTTWLNGTIDGGPGEGDTSITLGFFDRGAPGSDIKDENDQVIGQVRLPTYYLSSSDIGMSSGESIVLQRGTYNLMNDTFFGDAIIRVQMRDTAIGVDLVPHGGDRHIDNEIVLARHLTVRGEHSLELSGFIRQTNRSAIVNLLEEGETLVVSGAVAVNNDPDTRDITFDGTGNTLLTAPIYNHNVPHQPGAEDNENDDTPSVIGMLNKQGWGTLRVTSTQSTYRGMTAIRGGILAFASEDTWGNTKGIYVAPGGTLVVETGTLDPDVLAKIKSATDPDNRTNPNQLIASRGALGLTPAEASVNLDFTSGDLAHAHIVGMSVGAYGEINYTGTITPASQGYRLGGGGKLILAGNNQLTGDNNVMIVNGGVVSLQGINDYTGVTEIRSERTRTFQFQAEKQDFSLGNVHFVPVTLEVTHLGNGGQNSSIGSSSSDAENLVIHGGTLRYVGSGDTTDRAFTVGTPGATLDASGSGAVVFTNVNGVVMADADPRLGTTNVQLHPSEVRGLSTTHDILVGMTISGENAIPANAVVAEILSDTSIRIDPPLPETLESFQKQGTKEVTFGALPREFRLTGTNTGLNTLNGSIGDSARGSVVSLVKDGPGTWVLGGNNTYTGTTTVNEGRLLVNGTIAAASEVTVTNATIGGNGTIGGNVTLAANSTIAPGVSAGTLSIGGTLDFDETSLFDVEIESSLVYDVLNVAGAVNLNGLLNISLLGGFTPSNSDSYTILTGGGITGDFLNLDGSNRLATAGGEGTFLVTVTNNSVTLSDFIAAMLLAGDLNGDGFVGQADLAIVLGNWGQNVPPGNLLMGDATGDGFVGQGDLAIVLGDWGQGAVPTSEQIAQMLASASVPEPAGLSLLALGGLALCRRRRAAALES